MVSISGVKRLRAKGFRVISQESQESQGAQYVKGSEPQIQGDAERLINLPMGGGAIRGIGEKFSVNPVTGTGSVSVPIFTSPSRSDIHPKLSLSYDSGSGNGSFALGWRLSVPSITRKTDKGLPRYDDAGGADVFILSDAEDLVPVLALNSGQWLPVSISDATLNGEVYAIKRYRPRTEGLFARIERWQRKTDGDIHWHAITRDNVTSVYGQNPNCRIADPADRSRVFKWLLEMTFDDKGNVVFYEYKAEDATGINPAMANERNRLNGRARFTNIHIKRIHYGPQIPYQRGEDLSKRTDWLFEVVFDYGEHDRATPTPAEDPNLKWKTRADPFSSFRSTFDIRTYRLCQRVLMFHHFPKIEGKEEGYDGLVRSTDFHYDQQDPLSPLIGNPVATKLISIAQTGYKPDPAGQSYLKKSFPPLEFTYAEAQIDPTVRTIDTQNLENLPAGANESSYRWLDLDGEGSSGILIQQVGAIFYKRNLSAANVVIVDGQEIAQPHFAPIEVLTSQPGLARAGGGAQFMGLAADGRQDMVSLEGPMRGYHERADRPGWYNFTPFKSFPNIETRDPNLKFIDIDGDGLADILVSEDDVMAWYPSLGRDGYASKQYARKPIDEESGPALVFNDPTESIFLADMSGGGLTDIVRIRNGEVCYWPNLGYGRFGPKVTMDGSPRFDRPEQFDSRRIRLGDIDGSGNTDMLYLGADNVAVYFNQSGNSLAKKQLLPGGFPATNNLTSVSITDLLGSGTACLVWSSPLPSDIGRQMRYVDLMGSQKPHLLLGLKNNLGAETRMRYAPSTRFYVQDLEAGKPWVTKLAFPIHVLERVEVFDYIARSRLVSTYRYRHGYFDGVEREFRGFGCVEQRDTESFSDSGSLFTEDTDQEADALHLPPVVTRTWFHTGAWPDEETIIHHMAMDYFGAPAKTDPAKTDPQFEQKSEVFLSSLLPDTILPADIVQADGTRLPYSLTDEERREAVRALRGSILRQEIYAEDGSNKAGIPYSISQRNYTVECLQPQAADRYAVFFSHARETIDHACERNPSDPRITHNVVLKVDSFGGVLQSISAAYGRNLTAPGVQLAPAETQIVPPDLSVDLSNFAQPEQATARFTLAENTFTNSIDNPNVYRVPATSETRAYELTLPTRPDDSIVYSLTELQALASQAVEIPYEATPNPTAIQKRLLGKGRVLYLKNDLSGPLPPGQMDSLGLIYQSYTLALTSSLAQQLFITSNSNPNKPADIGALNNILSMEAGYVNSQGDADWWIPSGQVIYSPVPITPHPPLVQNAAFAAANFYLPQAHRDPFGQYTRLGYDSYKLLLAQTQDAVLNTVVARIDYRVLQPMEVVDPNQNHTEVAFDVLGMVVGTAVKGKMSAQNVSESGDSFATFTTDLAQSDIDGFIGGNPRELVPQLLGTASTRVIYHLDRFLESQAANPDDPTQWKPNFAAAISRETHVAIIPSGQSSKVQVSFGYSDGLGREIQKKIQAEAGPSDLSDPQAPVINPRWVGSGWTILNNKAKPVRQYEPFFSATHDFEFANKTGVTPTLFYDALGRMVATLHPNHAWDKVVFDTWRQKAWDVNDAVRLDPKTDPDVGGLFSRLPDVDFLPTWYQTRTDLALAAVAFPDADVRAAELDAANKTAIHNDTPSTTIFDVLGRPFLSVAHNRYVNGGNTVDQFHSTCTEMDIEGNQLSVSDALGRIVMRCDYDVLRNRIHQTSMEAGERWLLNDVLGKPIYAWDGHDHQFRTSYDVLRRPVDSFLRDGANNEIVTGRSTYGESRPNAEQNNLRGKVVELRDQTGILASGEFDFKGNLLKNSRQLVQDYKNQIDWLQSPALESETFTVSVTYDALNRTIKATSPDNSVYRPTFNEANFLETMGVDLQGAQPSTPFVTNIDYDAKGQRILIEYGNHVRAQYYYDSLTFRLAQLTTTRETDNAVLQDLRYTHDPAGNITRITDKAQSTIYFNNQVATPDNDYTYDAIYRLIKALGREHLGQIGGALNAPAPQSYNDWANINLPHPNDVNAMGSYIENFLYDPVGNIQQLQHIGSQPSNPGWTRNYAYQETSQLEPSNINNRLTSTTIGGSTDTYSNSGDGYDAHGNMLRMPQLQIMQWNFKDQLQMTQRQRVNNDDVDGTQHQGERTYYVYHAAGQRARKITESASGAKIKERIYLGGFEIYREYTGANAGLERQTLHVIDDKQRVALIETRNNVNDGTALQLIRYQFNNHLGSACLELSDQAQVISYEEYFPYGGTSYQAVDQNIKAAAKRYRYTGVERDEETGLVYNSSRYYASWLMRWIACDPVGIEGGLGLYTFCSANPIILIDPSGHAPKKYEQQRAKDTAAKQKQMVEELYKARGKGYNTDPMQNRAKRLATKRGKTPIEQHHHQGVKESAKTKLPPEQMGEPMSSVWSTKSDPAVKAGIGDVPVWDKNFDKTGGEYRTVHNVAKHLDYDEQASRPRTAKGLSDSAAASKERLPATADLTERAKMDWTKNGPDWKGYEPLQKSVEAPSRGGGNSGAPSMAVAGTVVNVATIAATGGEVIKDWHEGHYGAAATHGAEGAGIYFVMSKVPWLAPLAVMKGTIDAYDDDVKADANAVGDDVEDFTGNHFLGAVFAANQAVNESLFNATFKPVGTAIGEGAAVVYIRLTSDEYTLKPWKADWWPF